MGEALEPKSLLVEFKDSFSTGSHDFGCSYEIKHIDNTGTEWTCQTGYDMHTYWVEKGEII